MIFSKPHTTSAASSAIAYFVVGGATAAATAVGGDVGEEEELRTKRIALAVVIVHQTQRHRLQQPNHCRKQR